MIEASLDTSITTPGRRSSTPHSCDHRCVLRSAPPARRDPEDRSARRPPRSRSRRTSQWYVCRRSEGCRGASRRRSPRLPVPQRCPRCDAEAREIRSLASTQPSGNRAGRHGEPPGPFQKPAPIKSLVGQKGHHHRRLSRSTAGVPDQRARRAMDRTEAFRARGRTIDVGHWRRGAHARTDRVPHRSHDLIEWT